MRQMRERPDIHVEHRLHPVPVAAIKSPVVSETGVVDEKIHGNLFVLQPVHKCDPLLRDGEVGAINSQIQFGMNPP